MSARPNFLPARPVDVLSDVFSTIRLESAFYGFSSLDAAWGFANRVEEGAVFHHFVNRGAWLELEGMVPTELHAGEIVLMPRGVSYVLKSDPEVSLQPMKNLLRCGSPAAEDAPALLSGCFHFGAGETSPLLRSLPRLIRMRADELQPTLRQIASESKAARPGSEAVVRKLSDVLFMQLVRAHLSDERVENGWLRALADPHLGNAIAALHAAPALRWSVGSLAKEAGLSRSVFAERFAEGVGETPMQYLTRWRMEKASVLLRDGGATVAAIALGVGYESEASFSKAFKRWFATTPGAFRVRTPVLQFA